MHSSCSLLNTMIITGGRNGNGEVLHDVWALRVVREAETITRPTAAEAATTTTDGGFHFVWEQWTDVPLPSIRCAHVSCFVSSLPTANQIDWRICIFGGFTDRGVSDEVLSLNVDWDMVARKVVPVVVGSDNDNKGGSAWRIMSFPTGPPGRFGHALCSLSYQYLLDLLLNPRYKPLLERAHLVDKITMLGKASEQALTSQDKMFRWKVAAGKACGAAFLFGGVSAEQDFADIWLLLF
jgi:hypothetical protein